MNMRNNNQIRIIRHAIACLLLLLCFAPAALAGSADRADCTTATFRFRTGSDKLFALYAQNAQEMERLFSFVDRYRTQISNGSMPVRVDGYCISGSSEKQNLSIAKMRSNRLKSELITRKGLKESNFITHNHASEGDFVTVRIAVPKDKAAVADSRPTSETKPEPQVKPEADNTPDADTSPNKEKEAAEEIDSQKATEQTLKQHPAEYSFSVRTNLLRWATLTPDLGLEWRIGRSAGILVHGTWTSWSWNDKDRRYALWEVTPEVRWYLGKDRRGYLGAMYKAGEFNYKLSATGKQGDLMGGGLTGGYQLKLNSSLSLDLTLGIGYLRAEYDKYAIINGGRVRQGSGSKNWWGPTQAGVTLVWKLGR